MAFNQRSESRFQSPAKLFAILKSRVVGQTTCGIREENTAQMKQAFFGTSNELEKFGEAEALTISPIKSPQKSFGYSYSDFIGHAAELPQKTNAEHGFRSPLRPLMESTVAFPLRINTDSRPRQIVDKRIPRLEKQFAPMDSYMPPGSFSSPARKKLRRSDEEEQESENEDDNIENAVDYSYTSKKNRMKRCTVSLEKLMSPAKMFASMKARVHRREQDRYIEECQKHSEHPHNGVVHIGDGRHSDVDKSEEYNALQSRPESAGPVTQVLDDNQSDTPHPKKDPSSASVIESILSDPAFFDQPSLSIPKKHKSMLKIKQSLNSTKIPFENTIYLQKWYPRRNEKGLFVEGLRMDVKTQWNSNIIVERVSSTVLKTVSGNVYILVGKLNLTLNFGFPPWFLKTFASGFPANWKKLYEKCLSELKEENVNTEKRNKITKTIAEASFVKPQPKEKAVRTPKETIPNIPQADTRTFSAQVTRSGRVIKPPLDYWRGGRVLLDPDMNVTVFEGYNTTLLKPDDSPVVSVEKSKKPAQAFLPSNQDRKQRKSTKDSVQPPKINKTTRRKQSPVEIQPEENPSGSTKAAVKRRSHHITSSDEKLRKPNTLASNQSKRLPRQQTKAQVRSRAKHPPLQFSDVNDRLFEAEEQQEVNKTRANRSARSEEKMSNKHTMPSQSKPQQRSKVNVRSKTKRTPSQLSAVNNKLTESEKQQEEDERRTNHAASSEGKLSNKNTMPSQRKPQQLPSQSNSKKLPRHFSKTKESDSSLLRRSKRNHTTTRFYDYDLSYSPSAEEEEEVVVLSTKRKKRGKKSPSKQGKKILKSLSPAKAFIKSPQSKKIPSRGRTESHQGPDEDKWTHEELAKLQQAVSVHPLHVPFYWEMVARMVGTRSVEECRNKTLGLQDCHTPPKTTQKKQKKKVQAPKAADIPVISGGVKTLKRKQQVRQFLETMPKENTDDAFSAADNKRFEVALASAVFDMPSMCSDEDKDFHMSDLEPVTPVSLHFPQVKTPRCAYATPGVLYSPNRKNNDKYVFQLQNAMKQNKINGCKKIPAKKHLPTPSVKKRMKQIENPGEDSFVIRQMFPEKAPPCSDSEEEKDFYFTDSD